MTKTETRCCFGKDAWGDRRCTDEGKWRFAPYRGCSVALRTYTLCDAHKSKYNEMIPVDSSVQAEPSTAGNLPDARSAEVA